MWNVTDKPPRITIPTNQVILHQSKMEQYGNWRAWYDGRPETQKRGKFEHSNTRNNVSLNYKTTNETLVGLH